MSASRMGLVGGLRVPNMETVDGELVRTESLLPSSSESKYFIFFDFVFFHMPNQSARQLYDFRYPFQFLCAMILLIETGYKILEIKVHVDLTDI